MRSNEDPTQPKKKEKKKKSTLKISKSVHFSAHLLKGLKISFLPLGFTEPLPQKGVTLRNLTQVPQAMSLFPTLLTRGGAVTETKSPQCQVCTDHCPKARKGQDLWKLKGPIRPEGRVVLEPAEMGQQPRLTEQPEEGKEARNLRTYLGNIRKSTLGNSLAVQWLGLSAFAARPGWIPGLGTKIPQAAWRALATPQKSLV